MSTLGIIVLIVIGLIAYAFREQLMAAAAFIGIFMGIGALLFWWLFDNASLGATVGFWFAIFIGLKIVLQSMGAEYANIFEYAYRIISFPIWFLNRLQHILMEPWRYITKGYINTGTREALLPWIYPIEIILYILITPLRLVNAILYNIVVYGITELYDLFLEVFAPGSYKEGKGDFFGWLIWFPWRLIKYPIFNGILVLIEAVVWTVIDIIIPTITMYHGTDLTAAQAIVCNDWNSAYQRRWTDGTFSASRNGWAGAGVYFGSSRRTAMGYAYDSYRLSDNNPVMIACRVSLGKILNYRFAPAYVHNNTGDGGNHAVINNYAMGKGYTTGEWWNDRGYWEYCMFDRKDRYNNPWRIRPIYVFNFRTGLAQHIDGGFRHWLFSKAVINDVLKSGRFTFLVIFAIAISIWFFVWLYSSWGHLFPYAYTPFKSEIVVNPVEEEEEDLGCLVDDEYVEEPVVEDKPKPVYNPPAKTYSTTSPKTYSTPKPTPVQKNTPKSKNGFRLEKVDKIPTADNSTKKPGYRLEKVDRIPTKENPTDKNNNVNNNFGGY